MRAYGQRDPLNEYKSEAFTLFDKLLTDLRQGVTKAVTRLLINVQMQRQQETMMEQQQVQQQANVSARSPMEMMGAPSAAGSAPPAGQTEISPEQLKGVSRNSACPCGSGKKVKHCHGKAV